MSKLRVARFLQRDIVARVNFLNFQGLIQNDIPDVGFVKYRIKDICRSDFVFDYVVAMQRYRNLDVD